MSTTTSPTPFPSVAHWISCPVPTDPDRYRAPVLFTDLAIANGLQSAVLRVCGLGLQHVTIDGALRNSA